MLINVNPTRMELLRLKERYVFAKRGHKLLKDKLEGLMRDFLDVANKFIENRKEVDEKFMHLQRNFYVSVADIYTDELFSLLLGSSFLVDMTVEEESVMNVKFPVFKEKEEGIPYSYPITFTHEEIDIVFKEMKEILKEIITLSSVERELYCIAEEISKTRRRVNALEYIMIPDLEETIKYISGKLEEMERGNIARLLKIKDTIRSH
ncbi:MAG: V-type ATP synthase subunit D [Caldisericaceae bacterium]|nr:V-type ATP synthase subunit D [Caldisericaceae bacterium]RLD19603.1 MAG: V-type ATP synthase subunit D [Caldisericota bacterium]